MQEQKTVLEVLYDARRSLGSDYYDFNDWQSCTCGHIYQAAGRPDGSITSPGENVYTQTLKAIAEANQLTVKPIKARKRRLHPIVQAVSDDTFRRTIVRLALTPRRSALRLVNRAIFVEEQKQQDARLAVLAEAEEAKTEAVAKV